MPNISELYDTRKRDELIAEILKENLPDEISRFLISDTEKPFLFAGSINEDVNYYSYSGRVGVLNYSMYGYSLKQGQTQSNAGGMTEQYMDSGTYVKSFYSVMYSPSCVKISVMGESG